MACSGIVRVTELSTAARGNEPLRGPNAKQGIQMELSREQVEHIATLARLGLSEEEIGRFGSQLSSILGYVNELSELDTENIPPTAQVITLQDVWAADSVRPCPPSEEMLANAPEREGNYFKVRSVLGYET